jgi:hypothetical protein
MKDWIPSHEPVRTTRVRCHWVGWRGFHWRRNLFPQGTVVRAWIGWVLIVVMLPNAAYRRGA